MELMMTIEQALARINETRIERAKSLWVQKSRHAAMALIDILREITQRSLTTGEYVYEEYGGGNFRILGPNRTSLFAVVLAGNRVKILTDCYRDQDYEFVYHTHDHNLMGEEKYAIACIVRMLSEIEIPEGLIDYSGFPNIEKQLSMLNEMAKKYGGTIENGRLRTQKMLFAVTRHGKVFLEHPWAWDAPRLYEDLPALLAGIEHCQELATRRKAENQSK